MRSAWLGCAAILIAALTIGCADSIPQSVSPVDESPGTVSPETERPDALSFDAEVLRSIVLLADIELAYDSARLILTEYVDSDHPQPLRAQAREHLEVAQH